ncbi:MAG: hypothetical protein Q7J98_02140 [Kiritimatiellia bacterium]|nr:hypothetical protein [Kiritimatiellia bacterium]
MSFRPEQFILTVKYPEGDFNRSIDPPAVFIQQTSLVVNQAGGISGLKKNGNQEPDGKTNY